MTSRERTNVTVDERRPTGPRSSLAWRLLAVVFAVVAGLLAMALSAMFSAAHAQAAPQYTFTKVADSAKDGFDPFSFECSAINNSGDIAFRTARAPRRGSQLIQGIYRANADGRKLTTITEVGDGFDFLGQIPSINDEGQVSFALRDFTQRGPNFLETQSVMRGSGMKPTTIATTADDFNRFGFEPTVNNEGVVAFKADLDNIDTFDNENGLFSGLDGKRANITTHYLSSTSQFSEFSALSRPSINNLGDIAFEESVDGQSTSGIFVTDETAQDGFKTIAAPDPNVIVGRPNLNDSGTVAFHRFFNDQPGEELVTVNDGQLTVVADTSGPFQSFGFTFVGFTPPALNNNGDVAFFADLDSGGSGIFVGPDPVADRVVGTGDTLDGSTVTNLRICDEGLNDSGQLAFQATFNDSSVPEGVRVAVFRATPLP
jgi:hypothetical protein